MLLSELLGVQILGFFAKPLLMPALMLYLYSRGRSSTGYGRLFLERVGWGLLFSWIGDILLIFSENELFFAAGLAAFLIAHFFYISAFLYSIWEPAEGTHGEAPFLRRHPVWLAPFVMLLLGLYGYLYPNLEFMRIPVLIYAAAILATACLALNRKGVVSKRSFYLVFVGSLLFVFSDAIIALNRFALPIPQNGLLIMGSYIAAQYLIVEGALAGAFRHG